MIHADWQSFLETEGSDAAMARTQSAIPRGTAERGIAWLPDLTVAAFEGSDARGFLQGYLTCDTAGLDATRWVPAAVCSLKGRVVANGWCLAPGPERVLLLTHASLFAVVETHLRLYLRFSRTRLTDRRDTLLLFGGLELGPDAGGVQLDHRRRIFLCESVEQAARLWRGLPQLPERAWQACLIEDRIPLVSAATSDAFLPQMLNLPELGAINFNKGCYLGQEVVARAQHRGQVKRHLARLEWRGPQTPAPGDELADVDGRSRAVIIQAVGSARSGQALAVVQDDANFPLRLDATEFSPAA